MNDRLRVAWEYCRPRGICVPDDPKLEKTLDQCKEFNLQHWTPKREEQLLRERELIRQGQKRWRERHRKEPKYLLYSRIRLSIQAALKRGGSGKRGRYWENLVGYTLEKLEKRLRFALKKLNKRSDRIWTWQDFLDGKLWIDHIKPIVVHNFKNPDDEDFKRAMALENLQLLPSEENRQKGAKLFEPFQPTFAFGNTEYWKKERTGRDRRKRRGDSR